MAEPSKRLESYDERPFYWSSSDSMRTADRNASLDDVTTYIYQSLVDYQGKWEKTAISEWTVTLPYARDWRAGNLIKNTTTGEVYTIDSVVDELKHTVRLSGNVTPQLGDRFELADENMVNFVSAYPQVYAEPETWKDTITFKVDRREPGTIQSHPFDGRKEIKPRVRQIIVDPDYPDFHVQILGQWFDNLLKFDCWSVTNRGADNLISWFEDFLFKYTWVWKKNGVQEILYMNRSMDEEVIKWRDDIVNRTLYYYFRTEKIILLREHDFTQFDIIASLGSSIYDPTPSGIQASGVTVINDGETLGI
ncbi:hypothetical protein DRQ25_11675 [Candidatus Fermentibacteria bacterium]|nr:MAG: hypothetical protein DRQ25_11675 [Candidatus Fermentibacteria bacterium]